MVEAAKLLGRYRLEDRIAAGGMGSVYAATDERLGRRVAVKLLKEELADDPRFVERFRREARAVATLSHPNIANVFDYGEDDGRHVIVMEYADGRDLARILREVGPLEPRRALGIGAQVCAALGHAHANGVVHRDVKPANVIVGDGDRIKVTDFGIARAGGDATLTGTGTVIGSAQYLSPEQARGEEVGPTSDLYSLGIVLYEMLTGAAPFTAESPVAVAMRHLSENVPAPSHANPDVPPDVDRIVARATARSPDDRFANAEEMQRALLRASGEATTAVMGPGGGTQVMTSPGTQVMTPPITRTAPAAPVSPPTRRGGGRAVAALLAVIALLGLGAGAVWLLGTLANDDEPRAGGGAPDTASPEPTEETPAEQTPEGITLGSYIGRTFGDVAAELEAAGLSVTRVDEASAETPETIIGQDPAAGTLVQAGDPVTLTVSTGEAPSDDATPPEETTPPPDDNSGEESPAGKGKGLDKNEGNEG